MPPQASQMGPHPLLPCLPLQGACGVLPAQAGWARHPLVPALGVRLCRARKGKSWVLLGSGEDEDPMSPPRGTSLQAGTRRPAAACSLQPQPSCHAPSFLLPAFPVLHRGGRLGVGHGAGTGAASLAPAGVPRGTAREWLGEPTGGRRDGRSVVQRAEIVPWFKPRHSLAAALPSCG